MIADMDRGRLHTGGLRAAMPILAIAAAVGAAALLAGCGKAEDQPAGKGRAARPARQPPAKDADANLGDYLSAVMAAKGRAETVAAQVHMRALYQALTAYALTHGGKYPPDLKALGDRALLRAPGSSGAAYGYIAGQSDRSPRAHVLVYEETANHGGKAIVLRVGGEVELLTSTQLRQALDATRKAIGKAPG